MRPIDAFRYCPRCANALPKRDAKVMFIDCPTCGFRYYFNPAAAVAAFALRADGHVLLIRRACEPSIGRLAPPGGFVEPGETYEGALLREFREEVGIEPTGLRYLCSQPNRYTYRDLVYQVLDLYFVARVDGPTGVVDSNEVSAVCWTNPRDVSPADLAFDSTRKAYEQFLQTF
ncbi:MAG: NUDIX domain-containing protein [Pedosphaera sp.]|nr:NUDIX domain-containing protein [Pedosphaera sp.]